MNGYVTDRRLNRSLNVPLGAAQTELRAGKRIILATYTLALNQRLEIRSLSIHIVRVITSGALPRYAYTAYGLCSVGLYRGKATCSPIICASTNSTAITANPFMPRIIDAPGTYSVVLINNTFNIDLAVVTSGAAKFYY